MIQFHIEYEKYKNQFMKYLFILQYLVVSFFLYLYFDNYTFITPVRVLPKTFSTIFADASDFLRVGFLLSIPFSAALCARPSFF